MLGYTHLQTSHREAYWAINLPYTHLQGGILGYIPPYVHTLRKAYWAIFFCTFLTETGIIRRLQFAQDPRVYTGGEALSAQSGPPFLNITQRSDEQRSDEQGTLFASYPPSGRRERPLITACSQLRPTVKRVTVTHRTVTPSSLMFSSASR